MNVALDRLGLRVGLHLDDVLAINELSTSRLDDRRGGSSLRRRSEGQRQQGESGSGTHFGNWRMVISSD